MKRFRRIIKNKYVISSVFVLVYILVMHDSDLFVVLKRKNRVAQLEAEIERKRTEIQDLRIALAELDDIRSLEKYAREEYYFKKDNEDVFVFSFE